MKFSPGCNCCACVADADHVCLCSPPCLDAFPRTFIASGGLGTLSLAYAGTIGVTSTWSTNKFLAGQTTYCAEVVLASLCPSGFRCNVFTGQTVTITCKLEFNCSTGWKFSLSYPTTSNPPGCCDTFSPAHVAAFAGTSGFADATCPSFGTTQPSDSIPFTCDGSLLEFNLPATAGGFGVPGGGGYYAITPP